MILCWLNRNVPWLKTPPTSATVPIISKSWSKRYTKVWKRELNFQAGKEKSDGYAGHQKNVLHGTPLPISFESPTRATEQSDGAFTTALTSQGQRKLDYDAMFQKPPSSVLNLMEQTPVLVSPSWRSQLLMWIRRLRQYQSLGLWEQR